MFHPRDARGTGASSPVEGEIDRPAVFIDGPSLPHTGEEPEYAQFRDILQSGDHAEARKFYKQHPDIQLAPLVADCSTEQLVNLLPLLNLNRHHRGFDRHIHAAVQCRVLHHLLDQALNPPQVLNRAQGLKRRQEIHQALVFDVMTDFISENRDLDVAKFLPGCKTFDSSPTAKAQEKDKKEAILAYMRPDHPLYEGLKYHELEHEVTDETVDQMRTFFIENPQSKQTILETFSVKASASQLKTVLPHIPQENSYRKGIQEKVAAHIIHEPEWNNVHSFLSQEKGRGLDMKMLWRAAIDAGRIDLIDDLGGSGFMPPREAMPDLLTHAQRLGHQDISAELEFLIDDQENNDRMDVDESASRRASRRISRASQLMVTPRDPRGTGGSSPVEGEIHRPAVFIDSPSLPHTGEEPEYAQFRDILQSGDHAKAGKFYKQHPDIQLALLVADCSTEQLVNLLPLLNLNRHHRGFDRQIHAAVQCRVLHHLLDQAFNPPQLLNRAQALNRTKEMHQALVFDVMTDFISENRDLDVAKFLPGCKTFDSSPAAKASEKDKKEAILAYMRPDHPLYEALKYQELEYEVTDETVDQMRTFFIENPQSRQTILETFSAKASAEQLETVLPHIPQENSYRKGIQQKVAVHLVHQGTPEKVMNFLLAEQDKNLDMTMVWEITINSRRSEVAYRLESNGFVPQGDALNDLLLKANRQGQENIARILDFINVIYTKEPEEVIDFVSEGMDDNLDMTRVWSAIINAGRNDVVDDLEPNGLVPPNNALNDLLVQANRQGQAHIAETLEYLIAENDAMDVDNSSELGEPSR